MVCELRALIKVALVIFYFVYRGDITAKYINNLKKFRNLQTKGSKVSICMVKNFLIQIK